MELPPEVSRHILAAPDNQRGTLPEHFAPENKVSHRESHLNQQSMFEVFLWHDEMNSGSWIPPPFNQWLFLVPLKGGN